MSNQLTLADSINEALDTGKEATFLYNGTLYTFSPAGLITFLTANGTLPVAVTATAAELNYLDIATLGTGAASKAVVLDASGDYTFPASATLVLPSGGTLSSSSGSTVNVAGTFQIGGVGMTATAAELNILDGLGVTATIGLAPSVTTDGMDITITVVDAAGATVAAAHNLEIWMSEAVTGLGLTADTYSGDLTATTGTIFVEHVAKKHWTVQTAATGIFAGTLVDSANPADQYVTVKKPVGGAFSVSAASGVNWEGV